MACFNLLNAQPFTLTFGRTSSVPNVTHKWADFTVDKLTRAGNLPGSVSVFEEKLEDSMVRHNGFKRHRLGDTLNRDIQLQIYYGPKSEKWSRTGQMHIRDKVENGVLQRLVRVCGGAENVSIGVSLELGTNSNDDKIQRNFTGKTVVVKPSWSRTICYVNYWFDFTDALGEKWIAFKQFTGNLTLNVRVNEQALSLINLDNLDWEERPSGITRKMWENAETTGDAFIVAKNRKNVPCHKALLSAQSEVFQAMFQSGMQETSSSTIKMHDTTEKTVRVFLAFLYAGDIQDALGCCLTTFELLKLADQYQIDSLLGSMRDVILHKEAEWFKVAPAIHLWSFAKKKVDVVSEDDHGFQKILDKAVAVLKSKSQEELQQCAEFKKMFKESPDFAQEICIFFMVTK